MGLIRSKESIDPIRDFCFSFSGDNSWKFLLARESFFPVFALELAAVCVITGIWKNLAEWKLFLGQICVTCVLFWVAKPALTYRQAADRAESFLGENAVLFCEVGDAYEQQGLPESIWTSRSAYYLTFSWVDREDSVDVKVDPNTGECEVLEQ